MTTQTPPHHFEDRLLDQLQRLVAENAPPHAEPVRDHRARHRLPPTRFGRGPRRRRLAFVTVPLAIAVAVTITASSLSGSRPGIAQAAVIARAAAALGQPGSILDLEVQDYSAHRTVCMLAGECIDAASPNNNNGISADPTKDALTYSSQEWLSPDGNREHTIYSNGAETVTDLGANTYSAYDPATNTLTTLSDFEDGTKPSQADSGALPIPDIADFASPSYFQNLYREAQAGQQNLQLVGQTTIAGRSAYELQYSVNPTPPTDPPPGDMCGSSVCTPPGFTIQLYLDGQSFLPVRTVMLTVNTNGLPGIPPGTSVTNVVDYTAQTLPDTQANESLLGMSQHPGATQVQETEVQFRANLGAWMNAQIAANRARAGG